MGLFVGVTVLVLLMACLCRTGEGPDFIRPDRGGRALPGRGFGPGQGGVTRQQALNLWVCGGIYVVLAALSACRIASGNDYWVYTNMFNLIAQNRHVSSEFGFNALVRLMQYFFRHGRLSLIHI